MCAARPRASMPGVSSASAAAHDSPTVGGGRRDTPSMSSRVASTTFVGRAEELAALQEALVDAVAGRSALAFVAGESGVGKTRLLSELERAARRSGARVLGGDCVELGEGELPYAPLVAALRPLVRTDDAVLGQLSPAARDGLAQLLPGLGGARQPPRPEEPAQAQARLFEGLLELLDRLAAERGLLLTIEDIHWADRSTRSFLVFLASALCSERVLVVASYRPDELHRRHPLRPLLAELERGASTRRVELRPLTRAELREQLTDILGAAPEEELLERLFDRSEGNPLFAEELLAAGLDGRGGLPPTLRDTLMLRIERLGGETQELLRLLAVARRLDHATLAETAALDPRVLREALREAVAAHLIVADDEGRYRFRHALLREVVADDLLPGERAELHLALARTLQGRAATLPDGGGAHLAAGIAHHYLAAGDQPAALASAVRAARAAEAIHASGEAAALYDRALELWDRVADAAALAGCDHVDLLYEAAWSTGRTHAPARAESLLRAALGELDERADPQRAGRLLDQLAREQVALGRSREGAETRRRALALLGDEPSAARAVVISGLARDLMLESRYREAVEVAREALAAAAAVDDEVAQIRALHGLGVSLFGVDLPDEGERALREAVTLARAGGYLQTALASYTNLADALAGAGRLAEARRINDEALELAAAEGLHARWALLQRVELAIEAGDWRAAEAALPAPGRPAMGVTFVYEALDRAQLALGRGDHDGARRLLDQAADVARDSREPQWIGPLGALRAELERRGGDLEAARAAIDAALDRLDFCSEDVQRMARVAAIGVSVEADAAVRARDLGDDPAPAVANADLLLARVEACADAERPLEGAYLASARAEAARARAADDPQLWAAAAGAWGRQRRPYRAAEARRREAEARLAGGDRDAAACGAARALESARAIGAGWLAAEVEGFALRARLRLDREQPAEDAAAATVAADPFGLTPRERQVLALVAAGQTNREIGAALYMAEKTASVHVSRILAKLDVRSRTEAAAVAHRVGLV